MRKRGSFGNSELLLFVLRQVDASHVQGNDAAESLNEEFFGTSAIPLQQPEGVRC